MRRKKDKRKQEREAKKLYPFHSIYSVTIPNIIFITIIHLIIITTAITTMHLLVPSLQAPGR